jgi:Trk K+ transport system NAD-binding subunit
VVVNDATRESVLESAGIKRARTVIIVSNDDLANLEMALDARDLNPEIRVVLRMFDEQLADKVRRAFNIEVAYSSSSLAAPVFASASVSKAIKQSFFVDDSLLEVAELKVFEGSTLAGKTIEEIRKTHPLRVVSLRRGQTPSLFPEDEIKLAAGDVIVVLCSLETVKQLEEATGGS